MAPGLEPVWDGFVRCARNGHFIFERRFMTYHADRFEDASLVLRAKGKVIGLLPANRAGDVIHSHQGLTFGGLLMADAGAADAAAMLDACAGHFRAIGATRLVYKPTPWIYHRRPAQEDLYWLHRKDARLTRRSLTSSIRYGSPGPVATLRRRGAAKAARAGLSYRTSGDFHAFWSLLTQVLDERHQVKPTHSAAEIERLAHMFPDSISLHVAEGPARELLAGIVMFDTAQVAHAQYIAVGALGREVGALDGLVAHLVALHESSRAYFDFGISNAGPEGLLNFGLIDQKEGFGATAVAHDQYELELA